MSNKFKVLQENDLGLRGLLIEKDAGIASINLDRKGVLFENAHVDIKTADDPYTVYATLQKFGVENRNGRIYPESILREQVEAYKKLISLGSSVGELDHPDESTISLKNGAPHKVVELFWEGNMLIGKLKLLVSEAYKQSGIICCDGDLAAHYLSHGVTLGISSRGVGSLKKINGQNVVQEDFELICWDLVSTPSTYGSYVYNNYNDHKKYDEAAPNQKMVSDPKSDFSSKIQRFLSTK